MGSKLLSTPEAPRFVGKPIVVYLLRETEREVRRARSDCLERDKHWPMRQLATFLVLLAGRA